MLLEAGGKGTLLHSGEIFGTLLPMVMWETGNVPNEFSGKLYLHLDLTEVR